MAANKEIACPEHASAPTAVLDVASVPVGARNILEAAARLFARRGYGPTTMRTIAAEAQVTVPMVYYYFNGKEQIFVTLCECVGSNLFNRLNAIKAKVSLSFHEELVEVGRVFRSLLYPCPVIMQLMTQLVFGPPESRPRLDERCGRDSMTGLFQEIFESAALSGRFRPIPGYKPAELSTYFINVIHGHMMFALKQMEQQGTDDASLYEELLTDEAIERLVDIFLNGAGRASSPADAPPIN